MQYALLIYTRPGAAEALAADEQEANHREYLDIRKLPKVVGGTALQPVDTATTVRVQDGQTWSPTARSRIPRRSSPVSTWSRPATEIAARIPAARIGGSVEIRPVVTGAS